jgi:hypothetical protein
MDLKKDIFPIFIVTAIVGMVGWMFYAGFPGGIIALIALYGIVFGLLELVMKLVFKKTISQEFWAWSSKPELGVNKYCACPNCGRELVFPNRKKALAFSVLFITTIVIITVGHLLWK